MKISNLPVSSSFASGDVLAIEIDGKTYKLTGAMLAEALKAVGQYVTINDRATTTADGIMSASDKNKLNGIAAGAQVNSITGVKGSAESSYRTGNVELTPANVGALPDDTIFVSGVKGSAESSYRHGNVNITLENIGAYAYTEAYGTFSGEYASQYPNDGMNLRCIKYAGGLKRLIGTFYLNKATGTSDVTIYTLPSGYIHTGDKTGINRIYTLLFPVSGGTPYPAYISGASVACKNVPANGSGYFIDCLYL